MKRDMDLIRKILFEIEKYPHYPEFLSIVNDNPIPLEFESYDEETINYHIKLLVEAGIVERFQGNTYPFTPRGLTWKGHEFLDLMRGESIWEQAKDTMKKTGGMAFEILIKVLIETATKAAMGQL